ncbi:MAG: discoidin domain-containing protein [Oscillospiraceae bacterium]|nr:discoidin domain-containing protein [Oscillospiraceae bacterium]MDY3065489.1 discoidin domain-containing protein [Oscillospiraceae bacterium]
MKTSIGKRIGSGILALAITASMYVGGSVSVFAGDTLPYLGDSAKGENQPYQHGYRGEDLLAWSPETDPYAELLRAQIPLQNRNAAFAATQADPNLSADPEYFTLTGDYGNSFFDSYPYTNEFSQHVFNFWQYVDYYGSWHGMPTEEVPESLYDAEGERNGTSNWEMRNFEFGMMNLPNPAYTNAAHKNGALSIGCIFQPRAYQHYDVMLERDEDGTFPYATKLTEIAQYYGFDGWFFNMEGRSISSEDRELLGQFFAQMREAGMYIQWYTASSSFSVTNTAPYLTSATPDNTENPQLRAQSVFLDYGWYLPTPAQNAASVGLDPLKAVFGGMEAGRDRWGNDFDKFLGSDGQLQISIASLGTDFVQTGFNEGTMQREQDNYQWIAFERERMWWTGPSGDPTVSMTVSQAGRTDINADSGKFKGVAQYIAERSVVSGDTFVTNFNTGHGLEYVVNGELSSNSEWSNIIIQDILPTWQWWIESDGSKLSADFDYGSKYRKTLSNGTESSFDFDLIGAYNGGSSLVLYGTVDAENFIHLYKSNLDVNNASKMDVTFKKTSDDSAALKLGVIFKDDPDTVVKFDIANSSAKSEEWVTSTVDLSAYAGKEIAAFGLVVDGEASDYQINIGQMKYTSGEAIVPTTPTDLTIDKAYDTGEMVVSWDMASYDEVKQYNIYAVKDGKEIFLGGTYDEIFYIKNVEAAIAEADKAVVDSVVVSPDETNANAGDIVDFDAVVNGAEEKAGSLTIVLKAVSADGTESEGATAGHNYNDAVSNVKVTAEDGKLNVTWEGGEADVVVTTSCEAQPRTWTASGNNGCTVNVASGAEANGARYTMKITTKAGVTTTYDGRLDDCWSAPYDGRVHPTRKVFTGPSSKDWYKLHYWYTTDGVEGEEQVYTRGVGSGSNDWAVFNTIPNNVDTIRVVLEDYAGNMSEAVTINNLITVSVTGASGVQAGTTAQLTATVKNYTETRAVTWRVSGNTSENTVIDENGVLTVAEEEGASSITVTATSVEDSTKSGSKSITILPAYAVYPNSGSVYKGETTQFVVQYKGTDLPTSDYTWSVAPRYSWSTLAGGTSISEDGLLTVDSNENVYGGLIVTATSKENTDLSYSTGVFSIATALSISAESNRAYYGDTVTFIANYKGEADNAENYTWSVNSEKSTIANGVLTIAKDETATRLTVTATKSGTSLSATSSVSVSSPLAISSSTSTVTAGKTMQFGLTWRGSTADASQAAWSVSGATSSDTVIGSGGMLTVGADETSTKITVHAEREGFSVSKEITVEIPVNIDGCVSIGATIIGSSGRGNSGETQEMALDGKEETKWCHSGNTGWLAIDLGDTYTINRWRTVHGEKGDKEPGFNTEKFALEVLKDPNASASDLASSSYLSNKDNWTEIEFVDNSSAQAMVVDHTLAEAVTGRYFRLRIDDSCINQYTAVRIHEFQLYGEKAASGASAMRAVPAPDDLSDAVKATDNATVLYATTKSDQSTDELPAKAFDGNESTKWCPGGNAYEAQMIIDLGKTYDIYKCDLTHAGISESQARNTRDFTVDVLKTTPTAEQLADQAWLTDDANWESIVSYTNNQQSRTSDTFDTPVTGRYFRLNVTNGDSSAQWRSTRIFEWSLTGYEAQDTPVKPSVPQEVTWTVEGAASADTKIDENGTLTIGLDETAETLTVRATSVADPTKSGTAVVHVTAIDKAALKAAIDEAESLNADDYTPSTWAALTDALADANDVYSGKTTQDEVDAAAAALNDAIDALTEKADTTALEAAIGEADALNEDDYTPSTWAGLGEPLADAKAVLADPEATQDEVDAAAAALNDAIDALAEKADTSVLEALVETAGKEDLTQYTEKSASAIGKALADAKAVLADPDASQDMVDTAYDALQNALNAAEKKPAVDPEDPEKPEKPAPDTGDYTPILVPVIFTLVAVILAAGIYLFVRHGKKKND